MDLNDYTNGLLNAEDIEFRRIDLSRDDELIDIPTGDNILAFEVLEHIRDAEGLLLPLVQKARKRVHFSVPNTGYIGHRLRLLFGRVPWQWVTHPGEHVRFWTRTALKISLDQLRLLPYATVHSYMGYPLFCRAFPSLFCLGQLCEIRTDEFKQARNPRPMPEL